MIPKRIRRRFTAEFKAEVALAALTEQQPLAELARRREARLEVDRRQAPLSGTIRR